MMKHLQQEVYMFTFINIYIYIYAHKHIHIHKHIQIVELILPRVVDSHVRVRWAALNCIGQMCTDFGPILQDQFHASLLPALIHAMDGKNEPSVCMYVCMCSSNVHRFRV